MEQPSPRRAAGNTSSPNGSWRMYRQTIMSSSSAFSTPRRIASSERRWMSRRRAKRSRSSSRLNASLPISAAMVGPFWNRPRPQPSSHLRYPEWSPERFRRWARSIGPQTEGLVTPSLPVGYILTGVQNKPRRSQAQAGDQHDAVRSRFGPCFRDRRPELQKHQRPHQVPQSLQAHCITCRRRRARPSSRPRLLSLIN